MVTATKKKSTTELQRILNKSKKEEKMLNVTPQEKDSG